MLSVGTYCFLKHEVKHEANFSEQEAIYGETSAYGNSFGCELALLAHMIRRLFMGFILMCWEFEWQDHGTDPEAYGAEHC